MYDYVNGALLKRLHTHGKEVTGLVYAPADKVVLSVSWDRSIVVCDETSADKGTVLKKLDVSYVVHMLYATFQCHTPLDRSPNRLSIVSLLATGLETHVVK